MILAQSTRVSFANKRIRLGIIMSRFWAAHQHKLVGADIHTQISTTLKEWNCNYYPNGPDIYVFETEADKLFFMIAWS